MLSKEEIEKDNTFKISVPLITDEDIRRIDNNFETIVKEFTKSCVKEKDLVLTQYVMKNQQDKIDQLESDKQKLIEKLEEDIVNITKTLQDGKHCDDYSRNRLKAYRTKTKEILSILKGETNG